MSRQFFLFSFIVAGLLIGCAEAVPSDESREETETPNLEAAEALVADLTPYVQWTPGEASISFDEAEARKDGLSEERIALGLQLVEASYKTMLSPDSSSENSVNSPSARLQSAEVNILYPWLAQLAVSAYEAFYVALGDVCPNPRFPAPIATYTTKAAAVSRLTSAGYRYTLNPTGPCASRGPTAYGQLGGDYTKPLVYSIFGSIPTPCYRYQGVVSTSAPWTFQVQGAAPGSTVGTREPNPEICEYLWPTWWWGAYTAYFHTVRC